MEKSQENKLLTEKRVREIVRKELLRQAIDSFNNQTIVDILAKEKINDPIKAEKRIAEIKK